MSYKLNALMRLVVAALAGDGHALGRHGRGAVAKVDGQARDFGASRVISVALAVKGKDLAEAIQASPGHKKDVVFVLWLLFLGPCFKD